MADGNRVTRNKDPRRDCCNYTALRSSKVNRRYAHSRLPPGPLPSPAARGQMGPGHYALLFIREGVLSLAPRSAGCLESGVKNCGHR